MLHSLLADTPSIDCPRLPCVQVSNHAAVARFAARGAGSPGPRPVSAPLADPSAVAADQAVPAMDAALRHVAHALLVGVEEKQVMEHALQVGGGVGGFSGSGRGCWGV